MRTQISERIIWG